MKIVKNTFKGIVRGEMAVRRICRQCGGSRGWIVENGHVYHGACGRDQVGP